MENDDKHIHYYVNSIAECLRYVRICHGCKNEKWNRSMARIIHTQQIIRYYSFISTL